MKKILVIGFLFFGALFAAAFFYFFAGSAPETHVTFGVNFSQKQAASLGLDFKETYRALLLAGVKHVKVAAHWDLLEPKKGVFRFDDLDWQMQEALSHKANVFLTVGMKTSRWPECHIPSWAKKENKGALRQDILAMLKVVVARYKNAQNLRGWQVENEPFLPFGQCPFADESFLKKEVSLVHLLDTKHKVLLSDSGEFSFWIKSAEYGDLVGATLYRKVWFPGIGHYITYPFPPVFYWRKSELVYWLFGKDVIGTELQAEPWTPQTPLSETPLKEQMKTMSVEQFQNVIEYAKQTGLEEQYLWGGEWWYWMRQKQHNPSFWNEAQKLFES